MYPRLSRHLLSSAAFSTSKRPYTRRPRPPPPSRPPEQSPEKEVVEAAAPVETRRGWEREKLPSELPRPPTIPFQPRVANAVRLVGTVGAPVQLQQLPDGRFSAVSVLVQDRRSDFPKFWIPVIFQDDLAQIAASHLQENEIVYVSGQLTGDVPPFELADGQANIQVLAHLLSFVNNKAGEMDTHVVDEEVLTMEADKEDVNVHKEVETKKFKSKYPPGTVSGYKNRQDKLTKLWNDVITRPGDWIDNRPDKENGSRSAKYPDFTNKISDEPLWLNTAPKGMLEKLDDLVFESPVQDKQKSQYISWMKSRKQKDASAGSKQKTKGDLWQNLVDNPKNWWDNRSDKPKETYPDFKHKETGQALWIGPDTPKWAIDALPPVKANVTSSKGAGKRDTLLS